MPMAVRSRLLALALAGCPAAPTGGGAAPDATAGRAQEAPRMEHLYTAAASGLGAPEQLVIRDAAAWRAVWDRVHEGAGPPLPAVDFARDMVLVVALGTRTSGGYAVRVDSVATSGADATARYTATSPGPGCLSTQALTAPVDVVRVPRVSGAVRFEMRAVREPC